MYGSSDEQGLKGPIFTVLGSFILVYSTALMVLFKGNMSYLGLASMAFGAVALADLGFTGEETIYGALFFSSSGGILAAETLLVMIFLPEWISASYMMIALVGSSLLLRGVHEVRAAKNLLGRGDAVQEVIQP